MAKLMLLLAPNEASATELCDLPGAWSDWSNPWVKTTMPPLDARRTDEV